jgi:hypothetical protein
MYEWEKLSIIYNFKISATQKIMALRGNTQLYHK